MPTFVNVTRMPRSRIVASQPFPQPTCSDPNLEPPDVDRKGSWAMQSRRFSGLPLIGILADEGQPRETSRLHRPTAFTVYVRRLQVRIGTCRLRKFSSRSHIVCLSTLSGHRSAFQLPLF